MASNATLPSNQAQWRDALEALPSTPDHIPSFFFAHGSPFLAFPENQNFGGGIADWQGPKGPLAKFLKDFGPALLRKYKPRGIVVFSSLGDARREIRFLQIMETRIRFSWTIFGFQPEMYKVKFKSKGDAGISQRVVQLYKDAGYLARTTTKLEPRGEDGRGFQGPGLDHGVFVPFKVMFGEEFMDIPVVQVAIDSSMKPEDNWRLGKQTEGILVLSGGLTIHNLRDMSSFAPESAKPVIKDFDKAVLDAVTVPDTEDRKKAMFALTKHAGFRSAHPREDHFVPLYVAAGAGETGGVKVLNALHGISTVAFGL
ncbi:Extradiol aromatic ring-opening dioxygenase [Hymenopellis radicata]|nr:Extradiol aromatic ring-opening dioxygenase [Hymenopellis radicata]